MWNATQYSQFARERARPFYDLVGQIQHPRPQRVVDLGCGTGSLTRSLLDRWPDAHVLGIDRSPEMLAEAWPIAIPGRLEFVIADLEQWRSEFQADVIVSNAALQWVPDHAGLFRRLAGMLAPDGTLAVQMPIRAGHSPSQAAIDEVASDSRWADRLEGAGLQPTSVRPAEWYVRLLLELDFQVNVWTTTYLHVLTGEQPVLEWLQGTALRPLLAKLDPDEAPEFLAQLGRRLQTDDPVRGDTTLFPFPRLFLVAARGEGPMAGSLGATTSAG